MHCDGGRLVLRRMVAVRHARLVAAVTVPGQDRAEHHASSRDDVDRADYLGDESDTTVVPVDFTPLAPCRCLFCQLNLDPDGAA